MSEHTHEKSDCKLCEKALRESRLCATPHREALEQDSAYVDLHLHTVYSMLDGGADIRDIPEILEGLGRKAVAITDHGVMNGVPEFYTQLKDAGIKPILGCEIYLCDDRFDHKNKQTYHLTLLAETTEGYRNLVKISSYAFLEGTILTFGRPRARADYALLREHSKGIICLTGCMAAPAMHHIFKGDLSGARRAVEQLVEIFGAANVYGELQNVGIVEGIPAGSEIARLLGKTPLTDAEAAELGISLEDGPMASLSQDEANGVLVEHVCKPLGIEYVATGDVHYLKEEDAIPHDAMVCIPTGQTQKGPRRFSLLPKRYHMRTDAEISNALGRWPEAIANSRVIAERCNAEIEFDRELLPRYPLPEGFADSEEFLRFICEVGMRFRYGDSPSAEALERLDMELRVIGEMGFNDYFLIVWDLFNEAARRGIASGPGRGSAAGSIVAYCLGITDLCPLEYDLLFERFLNPGRKSMPDIDMDFAPSGRDQLIAYAVEKYNGLAGCLTAVAQIVTFGKFKAKGALRDAARVLAEPTEDGRREALNLGDRLARYVPNKPPNITLREAYKESPELQKAWKNGGLAQDVIKQAQWLERKVRTNGIHAAAVIIADHPLENDLPLQKFGPEKPLHVQYDMGYSEKIGLLKMDFLGLRNLDVIYDAMDKIEAVHGVKLREVVKITERGVDFYYTRFLVPLDDARTYRLFAERRAVGTFQFESSGMREALGQVRPTEFRDLIALVALYRPGSMDYIPEYAARKNGKPFEFLDPDLASIQGETYGITIYQEQSMQIARQLAGFSQSRADDLRKAIGKKKLDLMESMRPDFYKGIAENGKPKALADALWSDNVKAADYSFNKSHAACYAYVAYLTGFLKEHYPNEYMAALLSSVMGKKDEPRLYLTETKNMGLSVLPPDVNRSLRDFAVMADEDDPSRYDILFPLRMSGVGAGIVDAIRDERKRNGPFTSLFDLIRRMPGLNKTQVGALIKGGALDCTGESRRGMLEIAEETIERIRKEHKAAEKAFVKAVCERIDPTELDDEPAPRQEMLLFDTDPSKIKSRKLTTWEKRGIEGAAVAAWAQQAALDNETGLVAAKAALEKEALRLARAEVRKELKAAGANATEEVEAAGIADEEGGGEKTEKELIEERAQAKLKAGARNRNADARRITPVALAAISAELDERDENAQLEAAMAADVDPKIPSDEFEDLAKLNLEREVLKIYVSGHPLDNDSDAWRRYVGDGGGLGEIGEERENETVYVVGALVGLEKKTTKAGKVWYIGTLEDLSGSRDITLFSESFEGRETLLQVGNVMCCEAVVKEDTFQQSKNDDDADEQGAEDEASERPMKLTATKVYRWQPGLVGDGKTAPRGAAAGADAMPLQDGTSPNSKGNVISMPVPSPAPSAASKPSPAATPARPATVTVAPVDIKIAEHQFTPEWVNRLREICAEHAGEHPVRLLLAGKRYRTELKVTPTPALQAAVKALLAEPAPTVAAA